MKRYLLSLFLLSAFLLSLFYRNAVIAGASEGLVLWYRHVLPTLLPFMILTQIMMRTDSLSLLSRLTGPVLRYFPGVSGYGGFAVMTGFLCGYPMGAKVTTDLLKSKHVSVNEASFLLSFCNNMSPMFILGVLFQNYIPAKELHLPFFVILTGAPLLCSQLFRLYYMRHADSICQSVHPGKNGSRRCSIGDLLNESITVSADSMIRIAMYMMLASIWMRVLEQLLTSDSLCTSILLSSFEITTGLASVSALSISPFMRYILLLALTSFGGISSILQTMSMIQPAGLRILPYITEKLATALVTSLLAYIYLMLSYCSIS